MDSIRNLFGCELRIVNDGGGTSSAAVVFAVTRLDEYDKVPDDRLIDRLKVDDVLFLMILLFIITTIRVLHGRRSLAF